MSNASAPPRGGVGRDAFLSIRPSTNTAPQPPLPSSAEVNATELSSVAATVGSYTMTVAPQDGTSSHTTRAPFLSASPSNVSSSSYNQQINTGLPPSFRVGEGDLRPVPAGAWGGFGGNYMGANHPAFRGPPTPNAGMPPRYIPMFPGDTGPSRPTNASWGPPVAQFPGEPEPDNLPPVEWNQLRPPRNLKPPFDSNLETL